MAAIVATVYEAHYERPSGGLFDYALGWDGDGTRHDVYEEHNGDTDRTVVKYVRIPRSGPAITETWVPPTDVTGLKPFKIDSVTTPALNLRGSNTRYDLSVPVTIHGPLRNSADSPGRTTQCVLLTWPQVWAPRGDGAEFHQALNGIMPGGSPDPDPSPNLSKEEIATEVMNRMRTEFGGNIRQGLQDKARDGARVALSDLGVLTVNNVAGVLYRFFMDRVYQTFSDNVPGFWPWLRNKVGTGNGPVIPDEAVKP